MPRRRGGGGGGLFGGGSKKKSSGGGLFGGSKRSSSTTAKRAPPPRRRPPPPAAKTSAPPPAAPATGGGGIMSGMGAAIAQGMAFGTGSAVAREAMGAMGIGSRSHDAPAESDAGAASATEANAEQPPEPCARQVDAFYTCLERDGSSFSACQNLFELMKSCQEEVKVQREYSYGSSSY